MGIIQISLYFELFSLQTLPNRHHQYHHNHQLHSHRIVGFGHLRHNHPPRSWSLLLYLKAGRQSHLPRQSRQIDQSHQPRQLRQHRQHRQRSLLLNHEGGYLPGVACVQRRQRHRSLLPLLGARAWALAADSLTPFERAASEFSAVELRRLELEDTRARQQHERELRTLEVEHERNIVFSSVVEILQSWFDYYRSRENTEPLNTE